MGVMGRWSVIALISVIITLCHGDIVDPCKKLHEDDETQVKLLRVWNSSLPAGCVCEIRSNRSQWFQYNFQNNGKKDLFMLMYSHNGKTLKQKAVKSTISVSGNRLYADTIQADFFSPKFNFQRGNELSLVIKATEPFSVSCGQRNVQTITTRRPPLTATTRRTPNTQATTGSPSLPASTTAGRHGPNEDKSENTKSCRPKNKTIINAASRCGSDKQLKASKMLDLYNTCIIGESSSVQGCAESEGIKLDTECFDGEFADPCEQVGQDGQEFYMIRRWFSGDRSTDCTCVASLVNFTGQQHFSAKGLNLYDKERVHSSVLQVGETFINLTSSPEGTHRLSRNQLTIKFQVHITKFSPDQNRLIAYQALSLKADKKFHVTCQQDTTTTSAATTAAATTTTSAATTAATPTTSAATTAATKTLAANAAATTATTTATRDRETENSDQDNEENDISIPIAAACAGVALLAVAATAVACFIGRRRKNRQTLIRSSANDYVDIPTFATASPNLPDPGEDYSLVQPRRSAAPVATASSHDRDQGPSVAAETYSEINLEDEHQNRPAPAQGPGSRDDTNTYGVLNHGGQRLAETSDGGAIYNHVTGSDVYNVLQRGPERQVVLDNIYNTTNDV